MHSVLLGGNSLSQNCIQTTLRTVSAILLIVGSLPTSMIGERHAFFFFFSLQTLLSREQTFAALGDFWNMESLLTQVSILLKRINCQYFLSIILWLRSQSLLLSVWFFPPCELALGTWPFSMALTCTEVFRSPAISILCCVYHSGLPGRTLISFIWFPFDQHSLMRF